MNKRLLSILISVLLMVTVTSGYGNVPQSSQAQSGVSQPLSTQSSIPPHLPQDCGETGGAICAYGYVYYDGMPVAGASVHIESLYGTLDITTASGGASSYPYYGVDLSSAPLLISPGDVITVTATYYGSSASTTYEVAPDGQQVDVVISTHPLFGDGRDGDLVVAYGETVYTDDVRQSLSDSASAGQNELGVSSTAGFAEGDQVLIIQSQGAGTGSYEFGAVESVGPDSLTLYENLANTYTVDGNSKAQVLRVPQYRNMTVQNNGTLTARGWDGSTGGIMAFRASGDTLVESGGILSISGKGYGGGTEGYPSGSPSTRHGCQGEGRYGEGGCSVWSNDAGGGGGGADTATNDGGGGGGGGSHATAGADGQIEPLCPNQDYGRGAAVIYGQSDLSIATMGGGGGGGACDDNAGSRGGGGATGGGVGLMFSKELTVLGQVAASGGNGGTGVSGGGGGGGGAGGSTKMIVASGDVGTNLVRAIGGGGGGADDQASGGKGGAGRIRVEYCEAFTGSTDPVANMNQWECHRVPIPTIHTVYPHPAVQGQDVITFRGSAVDNDEDGASITQYVWRSDLDGLLSTQATFTRTASSLSVGAHTIYLKARDDESEWSEEISTTLTVNTGAAEPNAAFTAFPLSGTTPLTVTFTDQSTGDIASWSWSFGDGDTDTEQNPTHAYTASDTYTVSLTVTGPGGSDTETKTDYITVSSTPEGDNYEPDDTCADAKPITTDGIAQSHTFHQYADKDWVHFAATSGVTYVLQTANVGPDADTILELHNACEQPPIDQDENPFGATAQIIWTAPADGTYYLKVYNHDPDQYGDDATYDLSIRVQPAGGAAIIVAGHDDGYRLQSNIYHCTDRSYDVFANGGIIEDNIYYLTPDDSNPDRDADSTSANLQYAIETWAAGKVGPGVPLYLYLIDHGGLDTFLINGSSDTFSPADLDGWLTTLEGSSGADTINVFIESCRSGSFIDGWQEVAGPGRVVIASTSRNYNAYASMQGAYFSDAFFSAVGESKDLCESFRDGERAVQATGLRQEPWIDDDGDAIPNEPEDCGLAGRRGLVVPSPYGDRPPVIDVITVPLRIEGYVGTIQARVRDDIGVDDVWAVIYPPSFEEPEPTDTIPELDLITTTLDLDGDGVYSGTYGGFTEIGQYHIVVYAEDDEGDQAAPRGADMHRGWEVYLPLALKAHVP